MIRKTISAVATFAAIGAAALHLQSGRD